MSGIGKTRTHEMNMTHGSLLGKIVMFSIPLIASSFIQVLFNAADTVVLGRFAGTEALAAVGSVGSIPGLLVGILMGISIGVNVLAARYIAAKRDRELSEVVHTAFLLCLWFSVILMALGIVFARPLLNLLGSPGDVIDLSETYLRIYFIGLPALGIYNMGSAVLRSIGDTRRPMYFLSLSGAINVALNLFFVLVLKIDVAGVAWATVISESISAILVMMCLAKDNGPYKFEFRKLHMSGVMAKNILAIGLPAAAEGAMFSIGNLTIQSSINSLGSTVMASAAAASNLDSFVWIAMHAINQACITFVSQNYGVGDKKRVDRVTALCCGLVTLIGGALGVLVYVFNRPLMSIYTTDQKAIGYGAVIIMLSVMPDFIYGIEDVLCGAIRGLGYSTITMFVSVIGVCGIRILWVFTVFRTHRTLIGLYTSYPVSWSATALALLACYIVLRKKAFEKIDEKVLTTASE